MLRKSALILGVLTISAISFAGCTDEGSGVEDVTICAKVVNCEGSDHGALRLLVNANGTPVHASLKPNDYHWYQPSNNHVFDETQTIWVTPGQEACATFPLTYFVNGEGYYAYPVTALNIESLAYQPLDTFNEPTFPSLNGTLEELNLGGANDKGGTGHVTFDCANPNQATASIQTQVKKALLKKAI